MIPVDDLEGIRRRVARSAPGPWVVEQDRFGAPRIRTAAADGPSELVVWRDFLPAAEADVEFIAMARNLLERLVAAAGGETDALTEEELSALESAGRRASGGPWVAHVDRDVPEGAAPYIGVGGDPEAPDMYVWIGEEFAPSPDLELIAAARQDVPRLVRELRLAQGT